MRHTLLLSLALCCVSVSSASAQPCDIDRSIDAIAIEILAGFPQGDTPPLPNEIIVEDPCQPVVDSNGVISGCKAIDGKQCTTKGAGCKLYIITKSDGTEESHCGCYKAPKKLEIGSNNSINSELSNFPE